MGTLQEFIAKRRRVGVKTKSINAALAVVRRILNLAVSEWMDSSRMTWLEAAPRIRLFPVTDARPPYPLSTAEQMCLFQELPDHLAKMALFKVNTGTREQEDLAGVGVVSAATSAAMRPGLVTPATTAPPSQSVSKLTLPVFGVSISAT
jgi:hypothetical protein